MRASNGRAGALATKLLCWAPAPQGHLRVQRGLESVVEVVPQGSRTSWPRAGSDDKRIAAQYRLTKSSSLSPSCRATGGAPRTRTLQDARPPDAVRVPCLNTRTCSQRQRGAMRTFLQGLTPQQREKLLGKDADVAGGEWGLH